MKKSYEIVVEYLYPQRGISVYQEVSGHYEYRPNEEIIKEFLISLKDEVREFNESHFLMFEKVWVREIYTDFKDLY